MSDFVGIRTRITPWNDSSGDGAQPFLRAGFGAEQRHAGLAPIRCLRPHGDIDYLRHAPDPKPKPIVLLYCPVF